MFKNSLMSKQRPRSLGFKPKVVYLSDRLLLLPKLSLPLQIEQTAREWDLRGADYRHLAKALNTAKKQFSPELYSRGLSEQEGLSVQKHYDTWMRKVIRATLQSLLPANPEMSKAKFDALSAKIAKEVKSPRSLMFSLGALDFIRQLTKRGIRWGVITNRDPRFKHWLDVKNAALQEPLYDPIDTSDNASRPIVVNSLMYALPKQHYWVYRTALHEARARGRHRQVGDGQAWYVGQGLVVDSVPNQATPENKNGLMLQTVSLLERDQSEETAAIRDTPRHKLLSQPSVNVNSFHDLYWLFGLGEPADQVTTNIRYMETSQKKMYQRQDEEDDLWNTLQDDAIKTEYQDEQETVDRNKSD